MYTHSVISTFCDLVKTAQQPTMQINLSVACSTIIDNLQMQAPMDSKPGTF